MSKVILVLSDALRYDAAVAGMVTGNHGINADKLHGGITPEVRDVPLFLVGPDIAR